MVNEATIKISGASHGQQATGLSPLFQLLQQSEILKWHRTENKLLIAYFCAFFTLLEKLVGKNGVLGSLPKGELTCE